ncbi:MAG: hypothetical protein KGH98_01145 [Candidatus Micrarchaeota archaeon]|nr:hypothetical protein [Candidatus Micrarchaeota archaeon]
MPNYQNQRIFTITELKDETPEVLLVRLRAQDGAKYTFDPGMFIMISGLEQQTGKTYIARAFSIASEPELSEVELFVVKVHEGHTSHFIESRIGDTFLIGNPNGQFKFLPDKDSKVLFVAGGTGLAPFMSMLRHMKRINADNDAILLYSIKYPTEIIKKEELESLAQQLKLRTYITVTRPQPGDGWAGETGHIDADKIRKLAPDLSERGVYICGPLPFVKAIKDALTSLGVPQERVKADVWG